MKIFISTETEVIIFISTQPDSVNLWYFKLRLSDLPKYIKYVNILELEN